MEIFIKLCVTAVTAAVIALSIKKDVPQLAFALSLCTGLFILTCSFTVLSELTSDIKQIMDSSGIDIAVFSPLLKICCLSVMTKIVGEICRDAGERALAEKLSLFSKIAQLGLILPLIRDVLNSLSEICSKI